MATHVLAAGEDVVQDIRSKWREEAEANPALFLEAVRAIGSEVTAVALSEANEMVRRQALPKRLRPFLVRLSKT